MKKKPNLEHQLQRGIKKALAEITSRLEKTCRQMKASDLFTKEEVGAFMRMGFVEVQELLIDRLCPLLVKTTAALDDGLIDEPPSYDESPVGMAMEEICEFRLNQVKKGEFVPACLEKIDEIMKFIRSGSCVYERDLCDGVPLAFLELWNMIDPSNEERQGEVQGNAGKKRVGVLPAVKGCEAHPCINVVSDAMIKVFAKDGAPVEISVERPSYWKILNRFLKSLKKGDDHSVGHYPVDFTTKDYNRTEGEFRTFVDRFMNRQPAIKKLRRKTYEPYARFRIELLRTIPPAKG